MSLSNIFHWVLHPISSWRFWRAKRRSLRLWNELPASDRERHREEFIGIAGKLEQMFRDRKSSAEMEAEVIRLVARNVFREHLKVALDDSLVRSREIPQR